ncbi:MAG TPA: LacI family transcriptional regulator, partial [Spirochaetales bacterium]|nr:LacI family transcriptional regulator [Spirochaetales bacterium]
MKQLGWLFIVAALSLSIIGGGVYALVSNFRKQIPQEVQKLIGLSLANLSEPWRISMTEEITNQAKQYPDMRIIITDAVDSIERQVADVRRLLEY